MTTQFDRLCYFELIDRSRGGHIIVDRIVISDSETPPDDGRVDPRVEGLLEREDVRSFSDLAGAYQRLYQTALQEQGDGDADPLVDALRPTLTLEETVVVLPAVAQAKLQSRRQQRAKFERSIPVSSFAMTSRDESPGDIKIHLRGNHKNLGEEVPRGFLRVISSAPPDRKYERQRPATNRSGAGSQRQPSTGARDGQSHLEAPLRAGDRALGGQFRQDRRAPNPSRTARLLGAEIHRRRLVREGHAPPDGSEQHLPYVEPSGCAG